MGSIGTRNIIDEEQTEGTAEGAAVPSVSLPARRTGPRTPTGKARSKHNALKHGILASFALVRGESRPEFEALLSGIRNDLRPEGTLEEVLVEKLASLFWRYRRLLIAEGAEIQRGTNYYSLDKFEREGQEAAAFLRSEQEAKAGLFAGIKNSHIRELCIEALQMLKQSISVKGFRLSLDSRVLVQVYGGNELKAANNPVIVAYATYFRPGGYAAIAREKEEPADAEKRKAKFLDILQLQIDRLQGYADFAGKRAARKDKIEALRQNVPSAPEADRFLRYEASLERSIDRTLSQLERLQAMRLGRAVLPPIKVEVTS